MSRPNSSAASEHDGARQRVAERWGDQQLTSELARIHWMGSPVVRRYLNRLASGRPRIDWLTALAPRVLRGSDLQVLVVGAGEGWLERSLARRPQIGRIDASDVSAGAVQQAAAAARRAGFDNIHYRVLDLDRDPLPPARYDLVLAHAALHHVEQLEHCFAQLASTLRPGGLLVYNEYVGPDRFQFSEAQMAVINDVMVRLPPRLRRSAVLGEVLPHKTRPTVAEMLAVDPSESVRSSELLPLTERHFTLLERIDYGGTLLQHLLYDIVQNFAADDPFDRATLELLCLLEESLIAGGALPADYAVVVAGKPPLPRWAPPRRKGSSRLGTVSLPLPRDRPAAPCGSRGLQLATVCRHLHRLATGDPATPWRTWVAHHHLAAGRVLLLGPGDPALVADLLARGAAAV
ncbi:MAG TPA: class I SAM-dependent methyltransferase, partial [Thermoanaerobaculia bacterium]|nr:class I SAM-dependent methyltransferase [Thermoanaerobaculia bacterium]